MIGHTRLDRATHKGRVGPSAGGGHKARGIGRRVAPALDPLCVEGTLDQRRLGCDEPQASRAHGASRGLKWRGARLERAVLIGEVRCAVHLRPRHLAPELREGVVHRFLHPRERLAEEAAVRVLCEIGNHHLTPGPKLTGPHQHDLAPVRGRLRGEGVPRRWILGARRVQRVGDISGKLGQPVHCGCRKGKIDGARREALVVKGGAARDNVDVVDRAVQIPRRPVRKRPLRHVEDALPVVLRLVFVCHHNRRRRLLRPDGVHEDAEERERGAPVSGAKIRQVEWRPNHSGTPSRSEDPVKCGQSGPLTAGDDVEAALGGRGVVPRASLAKRHVLAPSFGDQLRERAPLSAHG
mmetsp:Transcript_18124/g.59306  ORF Transcript_18124/g.59306 Transcript_18124/m.59306 type:complete len:352 (+) Transcript_18124:489-1544(+)|eukprot:scaffold836_cov123-Isochrysis_galbana.AAC.12